MFECGKKYLVSSDKFKECNVALNDKSFLKSEELIVYYYYDTIDCKLFKEGTVVRLFRYNDTTIFEMFNNNVSQMECLFKIDIEEFRSCKINTYTCFLQGIMIVERHNYQLSDGIRFVLDRNYYLGNYDYEIEVVYEEIYEQKISCLLNYLKDELLAQSKYKRFYNIKLKRALHNVNNLLKISINDNQDNSLMDTCFMEIVEYIDKNINKKLQLDILCKKNLNNRTTFADMFKSIMGISLSGYLTLGRILKARKMLVYTSMHISEISTQLGFVDDSYFIKRFKKFVGMTPHKYKRLMLTELNISNQEESIYEKKDKD